MVICINLNQRGVVRSAAWGKQGLQRTKKIPPSAARVLCCTRVTRRVMCVPQQLTRGEKRGCIAYRWRSGENKKVNALPFPGKKRERGKCKFTPLRLLFI